MMHYPEIIPYLYEQAKDVLKKLLPYWYNPLLIILKVDNENNSELYLAQWKINQPDKINKYQGK